jgi:hypothetical protein
MALGSVAATASTLALVVPTGAAAAGNEKVYAATWEMPCVVGTGSLNIQTVLTVSTSATGPETVTPGEEVNFTKTSATITGPVELSNSFASLGAKETRGAVTNFVLNGQGTSPAEINIGKPSEYPTGLPFRAPVEAGQLTKFPVPSLLVGETGRTFSFGPLKVTGAVGSKFKITLNSAPGYVEAETGFKATEEGIISNVSAYNAGGEKIIGPLAVDCSAPSGVVLGEAPIVEGATTTTSTSSSSSSSTTTTTTTTTSKTTTTTTTTTPEGPITVPFKNWVLRGSLTVKKLNEKITLPNGSTFNGTATIPGTLTGDTSVPPFSAAIKLFGFVPTTLGVTFTESGHATGTVTPVAGGNLAIKGTAKDVIGITGVGFLGLNVPVSCKTVEAVTFPLETTSSALALSKGLSFSGTTTLPKVTCTGGLLGSLFGPIITELMSGPNNPFALTISPT